MYEEWLAMGIDCDGSIIANEQLKRTVVKFSSNYVEFAREFQRRCTINDIQTGFREYFYKTYTSPHYIVNIGGTHEKPNPETRLKFLKLIMPYLVLKKEKALLAIKILETSSRTNDWHKYRELVG